MYGKFEQILFKFEKIIVMIPFVAIFLTVVEQVIQRAFDLPIPDTSDISLVAQPTFTFLCVGLLVYTEGHITIEVHKMIKNANVLFVVELVGSVCMLFIGGIFLYLSYGLLGFAFESGSSTMAMKIPMWIPYGSMFVGMILMLIHEIGAILKLFYYRKHPSERAEIDIESMR
jgi:TRAP-type C4-dicarboxylate transport system permease small subunit